MKADLILYNANNHTVDKTNPRAEAAAVKDGRFIVVCSETDFIDFKVYDTRAIDLKGKTHVPGLNDSLLHLIRGGLNYNLELRWEGDPSLGDDMCKVNDQVDRSPTPP